ncbi:MAG: amino acid permease [Ferruginibacter sp.]|uniref:amino acid permease n=1 Tax=Ferruginibacter sp. TaxID=1940288 RepID=UPI0026599D07|nr:amino acid permease [Ferruginibacter sp.]MDB5279899.1 amino acid permease [Ferruginibacter sp.]
MPDQLPKENKLGLWTSTSLVVGNMIGAGVFLMPATLASYGSISLVGWVFATAGAFLLAKVFSNLSKLMPLADGGPYAYSREGLGDFAGFLVAWGYWISIWCTNAAIAVSLVSALSTFFPMLATNSLAAIATGLGTIWLLTWVNSLGIVTSGVVQLVTTVLKIIPLLAVAIGGLFFLKISYFLPFNTSGTSSIAAITATTAFTFFAFTGLECATIPSGSVNNPEKTISRATMLGTGLAAIIYILSTVSVMGMIPAGKLSHSLTPFADTAVLLWGSSARYWVSGGVAIAAFGALNGWILIQGQTPYAISKDKLFPAIFGKVNKKGVPIAGIVIGSVLVSILMIMNYTKGLAEQFKFLLLLTTITVLISYLFSTVAYVLIKLQRKLTPASGHWPATILLASLTFLFSLWAIGGSGQEPVYWGFILILAGLPFYAMILWKKGKQL